MKDQADHLRAHGVRAALLCSLLTAQQTREAEAAIAEGRLSLIYTTPERLAKPEVRDLLKRNPVDLFVVDEAHCISQWGHDFRPEYSILGEAIAELGQPPVLALTATATSDVIDDVLAQLRIPDALVVHTGFYRPNLELAVAPVSGEAHKHNLLVQRLQQAEGTGIVYCATIKAVEELTDLLRTASLGVQPYHGRMALKRRNEVQDHFMSGHLQAMVATNAFGLGIDKPDIRFVIHYHLPGTLEAYYQEFGRAGRDGAAARCTLLFDPADHRLQRLLQGGRYPSEDDLINAYHTLQRFCDAPQPPSIRDLNAISPVPKSRLRACLAMLIRHGLVHSEKGQCYRLLRHDLSSDELARIGRSHRERRVRDQLKLQRMLDYAQGSACRWQMLLDYFNSDELPSGPCGHCDHCSAISFTVADSA